MNNNTIPVSKNDTKHDIDYITTDSGNADRLIEEQGRDFRYCEPLGGWLHWTGIRWKVDNAAIWECAKSIGKSFQRQAAEEEKKGESDRLWQHGRYSLGEPGMRRMISLAEKDSRVRIEPQTFDADHYLLNVLNGTINLRTGTLHDHDRDDLITMLAPVSFDPKAKAPAWYRFVRRVIPNGVTRRYLRKALGQALTGSQDEQTFYLNQGIGDNGKNTFYDLLLALLGDYAGVLNIDALMEKGKASNASPDLVTLKGKRFMVASESDENQRLKPGLIKRLTGDESITARDLYKSNITFERTFTMFMHVNHKPDIGDTGHAMWRRVRLISWKVQIPNREKNPNLPGMLRRELSGILNWLLEGYRLYLEEGLQPSGEVAEATQQYRDEQNKLKRFIADKCIIKMPGSGIREELCVPKADLYEAYKSWCDGEGVSPEEKRKFGEHMVEQGYDPNAQKKLAGKNCKIWRGIGLLHQ